MLPKFVNGQRGEENDTSGVLPTFCQGMHAEVEVFLQGHVIHEFMV